METPTLEHPATATAGSTMWKIDPNHSTIGFAVKHMMFATVHGRFDGFRGTIWFDPEHVERSGVYVTIQTASIDTGVGARDNHLRSADFFDVEKYPAATFRSTSIEGEGERFVIHGELTIKDITRPVTLVAEYQGRGITPSGVKVAGFGAKGKLNRRDFGLNWNQALESGGVLVGDEINLSFDIQASSLTS